MTLPLAEASRAAGVPAAAMKRWVDNNKVPLSRSDIKGAGPGAYREYSRGTTVHTAITYLLTQVGLRSAHASRCAAAFTDSDSIGRRAGQLYPAGRTLLIVSKGGDPAVVNVPPGALVTDVFVDEAMAVVDVGAIVARVYATLGTTSTNNSRRRHSAAPNDLELSRVKH